MPQPCSVCIHLNRNEIDTALLNGVSLRNIAEQHGLSTTALHRHKQAAHIPAALTQAKQAEEASDADDLLAEVRKLHKLSLYLLSRAEKSGDLRAMQGGIREARSCIELLAKLRGELDERPVVNVRVSPQWVTIRTLLMTVLAPYPDARQAAAQALEEVQLDS